MVIIDPSIQEYPDILEIIMPNATQFRVDVALDQTLFGWSSQHDIWTVTVDNVIA